MKAGLFTAQLGVSLDVSAHLLVLKAAGRSYQIHREQFDGCEGTSILGIFKRGVRLRHSDPHLPSVIVFYPSIGQQNLLGELFRLGWS